MGARNVAFFKEHYSTEYEIWRKYSSNRFGNWEKNGIGYNVNEFQIESIQIAQEMKVSLLTEFSVSEAGSYYDSQVQSAAAAGIDAAFKSITKGGSIGHIFNMGGVAGTLRNAAKTQRTMRRYDDFIRTGPQIVK